MRCAGETGIYRNRDITFELAVWPQHFLAQALQQIVQLIVAQIGFRAVTGLLADRIIRHQRFVHPIGFVAVIIGHALAVTGKVKNHDVARLGFVDELLFKRPHDILPRRLRIAQHRDIGSREAKAPLQNLLKRREIVLRVQIPPAGFGRARVLIIADADDQSQFVIGLSVRNCGQQEGARK